MIEISSGVCRCENVSMTSPMPMPMPSDEQNAHGAPIAPAQRRQQHHARKADDELFEARAHAEQRGEVMAQRQFEVRRARCRFGCRCARAPARRRRARRTPAAADRCGSARRTLRADCAMPESKRSVKRYSASAMSGGSARTSFTPRNASTSSIISGELMMPTTTSAPSSATPVAISVQRRLRTICAPMRGVGSS